MKDILKKPDVEIERIHDEKLVAQLIDAYRKRDYYGKMCDIADLKIADLCRKMSLDDIKYCIERTSN